MQLGDQITADEVWRQFLYTEVTTVREGTKENADQALAYVNSPELGEYLKKLGSVDPDDWHTLGPIGALAGPIRQALESCHGATLGGLPADIEWYRAKIDGNDDLRLMYYDAFRCWTGETLFPEDAEAGFRAAAGDPDDPRDLDGVIGHLDEDLLLPPMICLADQQGGPFVVLDGSQRAVAYRLRDEWPVDVIVGFSANITAWNFFPPATTLAKPRP